MWYMTHLTWLITLQGEKKTCSWFAVLLATSPLRMPVSPHQKDGRRFTTHQHYLRLKQKPDSWNVVQQLELGLAVTVSAMSIVLKCWDAWWDDRPSHREECTDGTVQAKCVCRDKPGLMQNLLEVNACCFGWTIWRSMRSFTALNK